MKTTYALTGLFLAAGLVVGPTAHAHIVLLAPDSWLNEDALGGPQKGGPCGPGGYDDVGTPPTSGKVTTFHAGETITVRWAETVQHTGHFRIALAENRDDLKDPDIQVDGNCNYADGAVPTGAHDNVLADDLFPRSFGDPDPMMFSQDVTLPDTPCEKCTLQLIQFMTNHPPGCIYYHCADIKILPAETDSGSAGSGEQSDAGTAGSGGQTDAGVMSSDAGVPDAGSGGTPVAAGSGGSASTPSGGAGGAGTSGAAGGVGMSGVGTSATGGVGAPPAGGTPGGQGGVGGGAPATADTSSGAGKSSGCSVVRGAGAGYGAPPWSSLWLLGPLALWLRRRR